MPRVTGRRIHVTERQQFKDCRRKWDYAANQCLEPMDIVFGALWIGTGMHKVLEHYYRGIMKNYKAPVPELCEVWDEYKKPYPVKDEYAQQKLDDATTLAYAMIGEYVRFAEIHDKTWEVIDVEREFEVRIPGTRLKLVGTMDLLVRTAGGLYIVDHKNVSAFAPAEHLELDDQMTAYLWLAREGKLKIRGCIYNQLRKKAPAMPQVLQNGSLSKNKGIDTSYAMYYNRILELDLDPKDYTDILEKLKGNDFVRRMPVIRTQRALDTFGYWIAHEVREMASSKTPLTFNPTQDCLWKCGYRQLCRTQNDGGDCEYLKRAIYVIGEGRK